MKIKLGELRRLVREETSALDQELIQQIGRELEAWDQVALARAFRRNPTSPNIRSRVAKELSSWDREHLARRLMRSGGA